MGNTTSKYPEGSQHGLSSRSSGPWEARLSTSTDKGYMDQTKARFHLKDCRHKPYRKPKTNSTTHAVCKEVKVQTRVSKYPEDSPHESSARSSDSRKSIPFTSTDKTDQTKARFHLEDCGSKFYRKRKSSATSHAPRKVAKYETRSRKYSEGSQLGRSLGDLHAPCTSNQKGVTEGKIQVMNDKFYKEQQVKKPILHDSQNVYDKIKDLNQVKNRKNLKNSESLTELTNLENTLSIRTFSESNVELIKNVEQLKALLDRDETEILYTLLSSSSGFLELLENVDGERDLIAYVLIAVAKACTSPIRNKTMLLINIFFQTQKFAYYSLMTYVSEFMFLESEVHHLKSLEVLVDILITFSHNQPASSIKYVNALMPSLKKTIEKVFDSSPETLSNLIEIIDTTEGEKSAFVKEHLTRASYAEKQQIRKPPEDFRTISIIPTEKDIQSLVPFLRPNLIVGPYRDVDHYLDVQFRLLREDYISPLREGIERYRYLKEEQVKLETIEGVRVHENVCISGEDSTKDGEKRWLVDFNNKKFKDINWVQTRRFLNGSLVCLSHDNFKSLLIASVNHRDIKDLEKGCIWLKLEYVYDFALLKKSELAFTLIETDAFFIAYCHNLSVLQKCDNENFPMKRYIISVKKTVQTASYLTPHSLYDFQDLIYYIVDGICICQQFPSSPNIKVLSFEQWPLASELNLNKSQYDAFKTAVTKEFVLIQGPPGTGKTYVGLKIVQLLYHNYLDEVPILILCYTNHALDQFLEGISKFTESIIRLGSRSKNENMKQFELYQRKKSLPISSVHDQIDKISKIEKEIMYFHRFIENCSGELVEEDTLWRYMTVNNYNAFQLFNYNNSHLVTDKIGLIYLWLGITQKNARLNEFKFGQVEAMPEVEAEAIYDVEQLYAVDRWRLYKYWTSVISSDYRNEVLKLQSQLRNEKENLEVLRKMEDLYVLKQSKIIGMTITGAAKNYEVLKEIGIEIVVIEEAAEILEAHTVSSIPASTKHLILIGDHQQLKPKVNVYNLAVRFNMDISLFERMINNGVEYHQLSIQHRMRPSIASLIVPHIYEKLENHESVSNRDNIKGVRNNVFFLTHNEHEEKIDISTSKVNYHESAFIVELCYYLLKQGYNNSRITILTAYLGQMFEIKHLLSQKPNIFKDVRVSVVDDFQGEENDIILISFVRSNKEGKIGFLSNSNRVCVSLSRARNGLYCIGNFELYAEKNELWANIVNTLKQKNSFGSSLQLYCQNHPDIHTDVSKASDFDGLTEGRCSLPCNDRLECGHVCPKTCHPIDTFHDTWLCDRLVEKTFPDCGHGVSLMCYLAFYATCKVEVEVNLLCGHKTVVRCHNSKDVERFTLMCKIPCRDLLGCGHSCTGICYLCKNKKTHKLCTQNCMAQLTCNHTCTGICGKCVASGHETCSDKCETNLICGHVCSGICGNCIEDEKHELCQKPCDVSLSCNHVCTGMCGECQEEKCHKICHRKCTETLACGHSCCGKCGICSQNKKHEKCSKQCVVTLPCKHVCTGLCAKCQENGYHKKCSSKCTEILSCGHACCGECGTCSFNKKHQTCLKPCGGVLPCKHVCSGKCGECHETQSHATCLYRCRDKLSCGHLCHGKCGICKRDSIHEICLEKCAKRMVCGHVCKGKCGECSEEGHEKCQQHCKKTLPCGHVCKGICGLCYQGRLHEICRFQCARTLLCGHPCPAPCSAPCPPCLLCFPDTIVTAWPAYDLSNNCVISELDSILDSLDFKTCKQTLKCADTLGDENSKCLNCSLFILVEKDINLTINLGKEIQNITMQQDKFIAENEGQFNVVLKNKGSRPASNKNKKVNTFPIQLEDCNHFLYICHFRSLFSTSEAVQTFVCPTCKTVVKGRNEQLQKMINQTMNFWENVEEKVSEYNFWFKKCGKILLQAVYSNMGLKYQQVLRPLFQTLTSYRDLSHTMFTRCKIIMIIAAVLFNVKLNFKSFVLKDDNKCIVIFMKRTEEMLLDFCHTEYQTASELQFQQAVQELKRYVIICDFIQLINKDPMNHLQKDDLSIIEGFCKFDAFKENDEIELKKKIEKFVLTENHT